ncbi:hypothetical protein [Promicromonospora sp. MEB111]|uniref:hypothetical protein n=1 Tax=Promicromonospora sp. MEB111 TaxID=3040301 RepID=UPI00254E9AEE|nr:hypothetical protein [Promicromonospora sp. MEB111]
MTWPFTAVFAPEPSQTTAEATSAASISRPSENATDLPADAATSEALDRLAGRRPGALRAVWPARTTFTG